MKYIYVESNLGTKKDVDFIPASLNLTKNVLISLIYGVKQNNFGFDTIKAFAIKINDYKKNLQPDIKIYIDSGGYSVIKGDVDFNNTQKLIDTYNRFLKYENHLCDYIFTLDIPLWGDEPGKTTRDNLYRFNKESLSQTLEVLRKNSHLRDKLYFVWQFANPTQYDVWKQLFSEFQINHHIKNFAIGGLVGIRERTLEETTARLDFSPFTTMAFKCFYEYLNGPYTHEPFRLHILGTYNIVDRLQLLLLEKLFTYYCQIKEYPEPTVTYDTISYFRGAMFAMNYLQPYHFNQKKLIKYKNISEVDDSIIRHIYYDQTLYDAYQKGKNIFELRDPSRNQDNPVFLVPLNIYSNLNIDQYFDDLIEKHSFFKKIIEARSFLSYKKQNILTLNEMRAEPDSPFRNSDIIQIQHNLEDLCILWDWLTNDFNNSAFIEKKVMHTIKQIGFKAWN